LDERKQKRTRMLIGFDQMILLVLGIFYFDTTIGKISWSKVKRDFSFFFNGYDSHALGTQ
jgi:hypothetical protein